MRYRDRGPHSPITKASKFAIARAVLPTEMTPEVKAAIIAHAIAIARGRNREVDRWTETEMESVDMQKVTGFMDLMSTIRVLPLEASL